MINRELFQKNDESVPGFKVLENEDLKYVSGGVTLDKHNIMTGDHLRPDNRPNIEDLLEPESNLIDTEMEMEKEMERFREEMQRQISGNQAVLPNQDPYCDLQFLR